MADWVFFCIWLGGLLPAYAKNRASGTGKCWSAFEAAVWPGGLGSYIAKRFYDLW